MIRKPDAQLLDDLVEFMREHPEIRIRRASVGLLSGAPVIEIEGPAGSWNVMVDLGHLRADFTATAQQLIGTWIIAQHR